MADGRKSQAHRDRMRANVQPLGAAATRKHGGWGLTMMDTSKWPSTLREMYEERVVEVLALPHIDPVRHRGAVQQCARAEVIVSVLYSYAAAHRIIDDAGEPLPVLRTLPLWESHLSRTYQLLGLVPYVNKRVIQKGDGLLHRLAGMDDVEDAETGEVGAGDGNGGGHDG